jgi:outer membrane protein assembly factor BamD
MSLSYCACTMHAAIYMFLRRHARLAPVIVLGLSALGLLSGCGSATKKAQKDTPEALYAAAREELFSGASEEAIKQYEALQSRFPFGRVSQQALLEQAFAHYRVGDKAQALDAVDRFLKQNPNHPFADYAIYLRGLIHFSGKQGISAWLAPQAPSERDPQALRDAHDAFEELTRRFPESIYSDDARLRMNWIYNAIAAHEVYVASYYYKRGAWLAAANRAQGAVSNYQQAPIAEQALYIMVKSYDNLSMNTLRDDAARVLKKNFPDSQIMKTGLPEAEKKWWQFWLY